MNSTYNIALRQSNSLRNDLTTLSESPHTAPASLTGQISTTLTTFSKTLDAYSTLIKNELNQEKAAKAQQRLIDFRQAHADYKAQYNAIENARRDAQLQNNRSELLGRRPHHGGSETPDNPYASANLRATAAGNASSPWAPAPGSQQSTFGSGDVTREQHALREQNFFANTHTALDEYLARGQAVLGDLGEQREMLKGTQRKLRNVMNTLGVSGETIRMVERRAKQDKWIFGAGVIGFFLFCWLVLYLFKW